MTYTISNFLINNNLIKVAFFSKIYSRNSINILFIFLSKPLKNLFLLFKKNIFSYYNYIILYFIKALEP